MDSKIIKYLLVSIFIFSNSLAIEFNGKFMQGHFIVGQTETNSKIYIDKKEVKVCLLYTSPSPRDGTKSRMPSSA